MMPDKGLIATLGGPAKAPRPGRLARLREDVCCVFGRDPAARSLLELLTVYPGVHALILHRLAHGLWRRRLHYPARVVSFLARMLTQIDIHPGARIGRRFFIDHGCGVVIGETAEIGDDVTLYHGVTLGGTTWNPGKRHPSLGDGVVVGAGATILGPVTVGARARVAANSVVVKDVAFGATVVGIPGRTVQPKDRRKQPGHQQNLPDPVGKALSCLHERIAQLELRLAQHSSTTNSTPDTCRACDSIDCIDCIEPAFDDTFGTHGEIK